MSTKTTIATAAALVTTLLVPLAPQTAAAQESRVYPWCSTLADVGSSCAFTSYEQCRQSARLCEQNPAYDGSAYAADPYAAAPGAIDRRNRLRK
jgi:Protein of unknown function (DUF3551)